jgi:flagellar hook-basal body complex protein FliE
MSIPVIEPSGFLPFVAPTFSPTEAVSSLGQSRPTDGAEGSAGVDFAELLADGVDRLQGLHDRADHLAVQAATGDLSQLHDYTIAATEASVTTQLTTAVRNKALDSFLEIMRMPI